VDNELKTDERLCSALWDRSPVPSSIVNADGKFRDLNEAWAQMLGYSRSELKGRHFEKITHPEDRDSDVAEVAELHADATRQGYSMVKRYITKRGALLWVELHVAAIRNKENRIDYFTIIAIPCAEESNHEHDIKNVPSRFNIDRMGRFVSDNPRVTLGFFLLVLVAVGKIPFSSISDAILQFFKP
jgi:PAS domain S-box-containing protein